MKIYLSRAEVSSIVMDYAEERLAGHMEVPHTIHCQFDDETSDEGFCVVVINEGEEGVEADFA